MAMPPSKISPSYLNLAGKRVLVTGATAGIGERIAFRFAELDCKVIVCGRRKERLESLKVELSKLTAGSNIFTYTCDVSDKASVEEMAAGIFAEGSLGGVDILINNAGLALGTSKADETTYSDMTTMFNTNVIGTHHMVQIFGKAMRDRCKDLKLADLQNAGTCAESAGQNGLSASTTSTQWQHPGHVVFISSVAGLECYEGGAGYCATKHAMTAYANSYRMDIAETPIRVTTIAPGMCKTDFSMVRFQGDASKADSVYADIVPLSPDDIADQVLIYISI